MSPTTDVKPEFFRHWISQLERAIEMFSGEKAEVTWKAASSTELPAAVKDSLLWWKQPFVLGGTESATEEWAWIGASEAAWSALAADPNATASRDDARNTYIEILTQSLTGTADLLSNEFQKKMKCGKGEIESVSTLGAGERIAVSIAMRGKELPPMVVAIGPGLTQYLSVSPPSQAQDQASKERPPVTQNISPRLDRIIDLQLPFSVVLGRAVLPIRDVIRLTTGSLVELDHTVDEPVELRIRGAVVARCDVVTVGPNYGLRIREIIDREDRLSLRDPQGVESRTRAARE
jgi:flagellar motor switch protein FliN